VHRRGNHARRSPTGKAGNHLQGPVGESTDHRRSRGKSPGTAGAGPWPVAHPAVDGRRWKAGNPRQRARPPPAAEGIGSGGCRSEFTLFSCRPCSKSKFLSRFHFWNCLTRNESLRIDFFSHNLFYVSSLSVELPRSRVQRHVEWSLIVVGTELSDV